MLRLAIALAVVGCGRARFDTVPDGAADGVRDDGAADGVRDDDGGLAYCATLDSMFELCADFDSGAPLDTSFDSINRVPEDSTTSAVLDPNAFSGSSSAKLSLTSAADCSYARLLKGFASNGAGLSIQYRVHPSGPWPGDEVFADVNFGDTAPCALLPRLRASGASATLQVQWGMPQQNEFHDWSLAPTLDTWSLLEMRVSDAAGTPQVEVRVDSMTVLMVSLPQCAFGGVTAIGIGLYCANDTYKIRFDDVVVDHP